MNRRRLVARLARRISRGLKADPDIQQRFLDEVAHMARSNGYRKDPRGGYRYEGDGGYALITIIKGRPGGTRGGLRLWIIRRVGGGNERIASTKERISPSQYQVASLFQRGARMVRRIDRE